MAMVVLGIVGTWCASSLFSALNGTPQIQVPWEIVTIGIASIAGKVGNSALSEGQQ